MVTLGMLWLPILLATVVVFIASTFVWMVLPHHRSDWGKLPDEERLGAALRDGKATPGQYTFPYATSQKDMRDPAYLERLKRGPVGFLILIPSGMPSMPKRLGFYFVYCLVINVFVAYLTGRTLASGVEYLEVFQVAGTAAILGYAGALPPVAIWFGRSWSSVLKEVADGVLYGLLVAGVFGWLWP